MRIRVSPTKRLFIMERDNWICAICGKPAPKELDGDDKHPLAPTLGHIIPRSRGGDYSDGNLRCEHLCCNNAKKDLLDSEVIYQLGLVGDLNAKL